MNNIKSLLNPRNDDYTRCVFEEINQSIGIEDDKDTFEDFMKILDSSNQECQFVIYTLEKNGKISSGILSALINLGKINLFFIIYLFTNKDFRRQGLATELISSIIKTNEESFFLAEVLDPNKTSDALEAMENKYSGVDTDDRELFWRKNRFHKLNFNYYNPSPDINNYCNGSISYNSLWINNDNKLILTKEDILYGLKIYFRYGYCANQIKFHDFEAYNKNKEQFSSLSLNEIYGAI